MQSLLKYKVYHEDSYIIKEKCCPTVPPLLCVSCSGNPPEFGNNEDWKLLVKQCIPKRAGRKCFFIRGMGFSKIPMISFWFVFSDIEIS